MRGLLLALRAMMLDNRGIAARPLAKELGAPHVTLWRHLHRLRALLPELEVTAPFYDVLICGRHGMRTASVSVGKTGMAVDVDGYPGGRRCRRRLVGENIRTWVNGTFHGVGPDYLESYVKEAACRARGDPEGALSAVIALLL